MNEVLRKYVQQIILERIPDFGGEPIDFDNWKDPASVKANPGAQVIIDYLWWELTNKNAERFFKDTEELAELVLNGEPTNEMGDPNSHYSDMIADDVYYSVKGSYHGTQLGNLGVNAKKMKNLLGGLDAEEAKLGMFVVFPMKDKLHVQYAATKRPVTLSDLETWNTTKDKIPKYLRYSEASANNGFGSVPTFKSVLAARGIDVTEVAQLTYDVTTMPEGLEDNPPRNFKAFKKMFEDPESPERQSVSSPSTQLVRLVDRLRSMSGEDRKKLDRERMVAATNEIEALLQQEQVLRQFVRKIIL